jgi:hypothetical protein
MSKQRDAKNSKPILSLQEDHGFQFFTPTRNQKKMYNLTGKLHNTEQHIQIFQRLE